MTVPNQRFSLSQENLQEVAERVLTFVAGVIALRSGIVGAEQFAEFIEPLKQAVEVSPTATTILSGVCGTITREFFREGPPPSNQSSSSSPASPGA